jgi:SAM-dependent methyltransferase
VAGSGLAYSQEFVRPWLSGRRRILEVGCGDAQLASWLATAGHEVTAVDRRIEPLAAALARPGLRLVEGDFMTTDLTGAAPFDAIILVAVLHHLAPLDVAAARLRALLGDGGVLLIDDFDLDAPDDATAAFWLALPGLDVRHEGGPLERWKASHRHGDEPPLHPAAAMEAAISRAGFTVRTVSRGPYLFRYVDDEDSLILAA